MQSAPDGWFSLPVSGTNLDGGSIVIDAEGYLRRTKSLTDADVTGLGRVDPIYLDRIDRRMKGRVSDTHGVPVGDVLVETGDGRFRSAPDGTFGPIAVAAGGSVPWRAWRADRVFAEGTWSADRGAGSDVLDIVIPDTDPVDGLVVDERGHPTPGATVSEDGQPAEFHVTTDRNGAFAWPMAAGNSAVLVARVASGQGSHLASAGLPVRIVAWEGGSATRIVASPPPPPAKREPRTLAVHALRAVDQRGAALAGARLTVRTADFSWTTSELTDARGSCELMVPEEEVLLDGSYFRPHAFERIRIPSPAKDFPTTVVFTLLETGPAPQPPPPEVPPGITGRIEDGEGRPVMNAEVGSDDGSARTDARGAFRIEGGTAGEERDMEVRMAGFPTRRVRGIVGGPEVVHRLPRREEVSIRLIGRPSPRETPEVRGATPEFSVWEGPADDPILESPDDESLLLDQGDRVSLYLPPGTYRIAFQLGSGAWALYPEVIVGSGSAATLAYDFRAFGGLRISLHTPEGTPVAGASVAVAETGKEIGRSDSSGTLEVPAGIVRRELPAASRHFLTIAQGFAPSVSAPYDLGRPTTADLTLDRGVSVAGIVTDKAGAAVGGTISWVPVVGPDQFETAIGDDGAFAFSQPLPAGSQRFRIRRADKPPFEVRGEIDSGKGEAVLKFVAP